MNAFTPVPPNPSGNVVLEAALPAGRAVDRHLALVGPVPQRRRAYTEVLGRLADVEEMSWSPFHRMRHIDTGIPRVRKRL